MSLKSLCHPSNLVLQFDFLHVYMFFCIIHVMVNTFLTVLLSLERLKLGDMEYSCSRAPKVSGGFGL